MPRDGIAGIKRKMPGCDRQRIKEQIIRPGAGRSTRRRNWDIRSSRHRRRRKKPLNRCRVRQWRRILPTPAAGLLPGERTALRWACWENWTASCARIIRTVRRAGTSTPAVTMCRSPICLAARLGLKESGALEELGGQRGFPGGACRRMC